MLAMTDNTPTWAEKGHCREGTAECKSRRLAMPRLAIKESIASLWNPRHHGMMR
jgi:hypothetical protein